MNSGMIARKQALGVGLLHSEVKEQQNASAKCSRLVDHRRGWAVPDQPVHTHGLQYQNDLECRGSRCRLRLAFAGGRPVGRCEQLPPGTMTESGRSTWGDPAHAEPKRAAGHKVRHQEKEEKK
jgi:hypothetical protein